MCKSPDRFSDRSGGTAAGARFRRLRLWELHPHYHCSVLGTCLTMEELHKVARQSRLPIAADSSDFRLHSTMVAQAAEKGRIARNLQRMLERKYQRQVRQLGRNHENQQFRKHWHQALKSGDIPGWLWALMTHPTADPELIAEIHQQVHMLSHLQGATNRADLRYCRDLEQQVTDLQQQLEQSRQYRQQHQASQDRLMQAQQKALSALRQQVVEPPVDIIRVRDQLREQQKSSRQLQKRLEWTETRLSDREIRLTELEQGIEGLKEQLAEARQEREGLELSLASLLSAESADQPVLKNGDLHGRQLIYVGGRNRLLPHMRALTEIHNGRLAHHDGGLEDSRAGLQHSLSAADMVFCAIDCISHDACLRVKRYCKKYDKPFIPLRSSSLSAFSGGLQSLFSEQQTARDLPDSG